MGRKVLIIDDQPNQRKILRGLLEMVGCEVVGEGSNGREAIELAMKIKPEVVIMDVKMPGMDGIEAAKEINMKFPTPIILCTVKRDEETLERAKGAGVMAYLVKPPREEDLLPTIEIAISRFKEFRALREEVEDLKDALEARKVIEKAKGVLMEKMGLSEGEAFRRIRKMSMDRRKPMKEVAEAILMTFETL